MAMNRVNHLYSRVFIAASFNIRAGGIFLNCSAKSQDGAKRELSVIGGLNKSPSLINVLSLGSPNNSLSLASLSTQTVLELVPLMLSLTQPVKPNDNLDTIKIFRRTSECARVCFF